MKSPWLVLLLLILCLTPGWSQPSAEPASDSTTSSPSADLPGPVTHQFTDAEWSAFEEEVWQAEQEAIKESISAAVKPHLEYERTLELVGLGEGAGIVLLLLALVFK